MQRNATESSEIRAYSVAEAAERIGVNRATVHRWVIAGRLPAFDIGAPGGRPRFRITEQDLRAFIDASRLNGGVA